MKTQVCAIFVTMQPGPSFVANFAATERQVATAIIVDNGSDPACMSMIRDLVSGTRHHLIENEHNVGIAAALNQGMALGHELGCSWALTLDQDSNPTHDLVERQLDALRAWPQPESVALIGAHLRHEAFPESVVRSVRLHPSCPGWFQRVACTDQDVLEVTLAITSGSMTSIAHWDRLGGFCDDYFIDYVDTEYCLRARSAGLDILMACHASLQHKLGDIRQVRMAGIALRPRFHGPDRVYYQFRNRIPTLLRHGWTHLHWWFFDNLQVLFVLTKIVIAEDKKGPKLHAALRGTIDGLLGRMGPLLRSFDIREDSGTDRRME